MKQICTIGVIALLISSCSSQRSVVNTQSNEALVADTVYYLTEFEVRQKDYFDRLVGTWNVNTMQKQARMDIENLANVQLALKPDMSFAATSSCGDIVGTYSIKGTSIKFNNVKFNNAECSDLEQTNELVRLLGNTVSAYTVEGNNLWLRDGSTNIIFRATR